MFSFDERVLNNPNESLEKKEMFLFQYLSNLEKDLEKTPNHVLKPYQSDLEKVLLNFHISEPRPNYASRKVLARCLVLVYKQGDPRSLFDSFVWLQNQLNSVSAKEIQIKLALVHTIGCMTCHHGSKLLSLFPETINLLLKILKGVKDLDLSMRVEALKALTASIKGAGKGVTDGMLKDLFKFAKYGLSDKYPYIKISAARLYEAIYRYTEATPPLKFDEYEYTLGLFLKPLEGADSEIRRELAKVMGFILSISQRNQPAIKESKGLKLPFFSGPTTSSPDTEYLDRSILSVDEMISVLLNLFGKTGAKDVKIALFEAFAFLLRNFDIGFLEQSYGVIVNKIISLLSLPKLNTNKSDSAFTVAACRFLLRDSLGKQLSELGQIGSVKELVNSWVRKWPAVSVDEVAPSDLQLGFVIDEIGALFTDLGPAASSIVDIAIDPLAILLAHPSQSVNLSLSWCLRCLCIALPDQLMRLINKTATLLQRDSGPSQIDRIENLNRIINYGNALASLVCVIPKRPLFVSFESAALVFGISTQLVKSATANKESALGAAQSLVAWSLIGALMTLGTDFVNVHLSQLLLIWKSCFPKPNLKESSSRTEIEWNSLLIIRYSALSALYSFLLFNGELVTADVTKRVVVLLNNMMATLATFPVSYTTASIQSKLTVPTDAFRMDLVNREALIKTRIIQCYSAINPVHYEFVAPQLLKFLIEQFLPDPERMDRYMASVYNPNDKTAVTEVAIETTLITGFSFSVASKSLAEDRGIGKSMATDLDLEYLESLSSSNGFEALQNDPASLFLSRDVRKPLPRQPSVLLSDSAIELFSILFPMQAAEIQESILEKIIRYAHFSGGPLVSEHRLYSLRLNSCVALIGALKFMMMKKGTISSEKSLTLVKNLVEKFLGHKETILRVAACEALARLVRVANNVSFGNSIIQSLIDQIVENREPFARAGSCLALGTIYSYVGGIASGPNLKNVISILHSLASDSHCLVHTWALHSMWLTIESAGLMFNQYVHSTLTLITKLFMSETHGETAISANSDSLDRNTEVFPAFGRILQALVCVLGPELQASTKIRDLLYTMYEQLKSDENPLTISEAIGCVQQFITFDPKLVHVESLVPFFQRQLMLEYNSQVNVLRKAVVHCLYQLTQRDTGLVMIAAKEGRLEEQLFGLLDRETDISIQDEIKDILMNLLKASGVDSPSRWLDLCQNVMTKGNSESSKANENQSLGLRRLSIEEDLPIDSTDEISKLPKGILAGLVVKTGGFCLLPKWKTQIFAIFCIRKILEISQKPEDHDLKLARKAYEAGLSEGKSPDILLFKLVDLIRVSFGTITSNLYELKLEGLLLLKDILEKYSPVPDPDLEGHLLLEQYQAQIISALAPAFDDGNGPELIAAASRVCAHYIGSGIHKDISTFSRLLKLINNLLISYKDMSKNVSNGNLICKVAILSSFAELYLAIQTFPELQSVIEPNLLILAKSWTSILNEYARLNLETDLTDFLGIDQMISKKMDVYVASVKQIVLPYYKNSWTIIIEALTTLILKRKDIDYSVGLEKNETEAVNESKIFYLLYGLCMESISNIGAAGTYSSSKSGHYSDEKSKETLSSLVSCLRCIQNLLLKISTDPQMISKEIFMETMTVMDRLMQTEGIKVQLMIMQIINQVISTFPDSYFVDQDLSCVENSMDIKNADGEIQSFSKLYKIIKVLFNVFLYYVPGFVNNATSALYYIHDINKETSELLSSALLALTTLITTENVARVYSAQLFPISLVVYIAILINEKFSVLVAPKVLVNLKNCLEIYKKNNYLDNSDVSEALHLSVISLLGMLEDLVLSNNDGCINVAHIKNSLLAVTIMFTTTPKEAYTIETQEKLCRILLKSINLKSQEIASISVQCIKSVCSISNNTDSAIASAGSGCSRLLLPEFLDTVVKIGKGVKSGEADISLFEDCIKVFTTLLQLLEDSQKQEYLLIVFILIFLDLFDDVPEGTSIPSFNSMGDRQLYMCLTQTLLSLLGRYQESFKTLIHRIPPDLKTRLEKTIKNITSAQEPNRGTISGSTITSRSTQPKIQLKNFTMG